MTESSMKSVRNKAFATGVAFGAGATLLIGLAAQQTVDMNRPAPATQEATTHQSQQPSTTPTRENPTAPAGLARRDPNDVMALGRVDAPVVIVEFADYRCPFCSHFEQTILPQIRSEYIDKGLVRLEYRDMPVFGQQSAATAMAGRAAGAQGKFWEYMDVVAANGVVEGGHPDLTTDRLIAFAGQAGVPDIDTFTAALSDQATLELIKADFTLAQQMGFSGVPAFWVNDTAVIGAQPFENFSKVIDLELKQAGVPR